MVDQSLGRTEVDPGEDVDPPGQFRELFDRVDVVVRAIRDRRASCGTWLARTRRDTL